MLDTLPLSVAFFVVASLTAAMVDPRSLTMNNVGLSVILFSGKLFANCNLSAKCDTRSTEISTVCYVSK